jgi:hypothetical protein
MPSSHHSRRHHHSKRSQPSGYTELSRSDIQLLTEILSHAPTSSTSTYAYEQIVHELVDKLPSHLRNKLPWLSSSCKLHDKIASLPITSIYKALQYETDLCTRQVWSPLRGKGVLTAEQCDLLTTLEDLSALWIPEEAFEARYHRQQQSKPAYVYSSTKCAGCQLAKIGGRTQALIALGAFFIGRVKPKIWKKSVRILWIESWLRASVDRSQSKEVVLKMWRTGSGLRKLRKEHGGSDRDYVDEFVEEAQTETAHGRPRHRRNAGHDHAADVGAKAQEEVPIDGLGPDLEADELFEGAGSPLENADGFVSTEDLLGIPDDDIPRDVQLPRFASSIYSRAVDDDGEHESRGHGRSTESELLSLYNHSTYVPK